MITKEAADIIWVQAQSIYQLVMAGYSHESARDAVNTNDLTKLERVKPGEKK